MSLTSYVNINFSAETAEQTADKKIEAVEKLKEYIQEHRISLSILPGKLRREVSVDVLDSFLRENNYQANPLGIKRPETPKTPDEIENLQRQFKAWAAQPVKAYEKVLSEHGILKASEDGNGFVEVEKGILERLNESERNNVVSADLTASQRRDIESFGFITLPAFTL